MTNTIQQGCEAMSERVSFIIDTRVHIIDMGVDVYKSCMHENTNKFSRSMITLPIDDLCIAFI